MEQQIDSCGSFETEILEVLDKNRCITLATSGNDGVRSRAVDYVNKCNNGSSYKQSNHPHGK